MLADSLNEFMSSLGIICEILNSTEFKPRTRHFKDVKFIFLALVVKANSITDKMLFQIENLDKNTHGFFQTNQELGEMRATLANAYEQIQNDNISKSTEQLLAAVKKYEKIFPKIRRLDALFDL